MISNAAFSPGGKELLFGRFNGQLMIQNLVDSRKESFDHNVKVLEEFYKHEGKINGIAVLPNHPIAITADAKGLMRFISWTDREKIGSITVPGENLTSLHISPDGCFMAVGNSDASMSFWDLRVLELPTVISRPFAEALPSHLAVINALANEQRLPAQAQSVIRFAQNVLRYRFRYDIGIDNVPDIKVGEFDIEVD